MCLIDHNENVDSLLLYTFTNIGAYKNLHLSHHEQAESNEGMQIHEICLIVYVRVRACVRARNDACVRALLASII